LYQSLNSALRSIPHDDNLPVPQPPEKRLAFLEQMECEDGSVSEDIRRSSEDQYVSDEKTTEPKRFNQEELNDLIRDLSLAKRKKMCF
jgi:hypothetical protein